MSQSPDSLAWFPGLTTAYSPTPIAIMFPLAQQRAQEDFDNDSVGYLGNMVEFASKIGPGFAPWVSGPFAFKGIHGGMG